MSYKCPICDQNQTIRLKQKVRGQHRCHLYRCDDCDLNFLDIWDKEEVVKSIYSSKRVVFHSSINLENVKYNEYDRRFKEVKPYLSSRTKLLEVGAGEGIFLKRVKPFIAAADAIELSPVHAKNLRQLDFKVYTDFLDRLSPPKQKYDIICMYALLEHVPHVRKFLAALHQWTHPKSHIFIEVPNLMEPLVSFYDIPQYRDWFYREQHLYTFTQKSLVKLLKICGYSGRCQPIQVASVTNHFRWMFLKSGQDSMAQVINPTLPVSLVNPKAPNGQDFMSLIDRIDDYYRQILVKAGIGDILFCHAKPKPTLAV